MEEKKKQAYRVGNAILIVLLALTVGEYLLGNNADVWSIVWVPLFAISVLKAFFIVRDFMHVRRLWTGDEEEHA
jgi:caa(3)-type oxidase subunit IV